MPDQTPTLRRVSNSQYAMPTEEPSPKEPNSPTEFIAPSAPSAPNPSTYDDTADRELANQYRQTADWYQQLAEARKPKLTAAQLEQQQQRARRQAATLDAINAIGNLLWNTRNSGNLLDRNNTTSKAVSDRYKELIANRDKQETAWLNARAAADAGRLNYYKTRQQSAANRAAHDLTQQQLEIARQKNALALATAAQKQSNWEKDFKEKKDYHDAKAAVAKQNANANQIRANANQIRANKTGSGRGSGGSRNNNNGYYAYDRYGKIHYFKNSGGAKTFAQNEGTWVNETTSRTTNLTGLNSNSTTEKRGGYSQNPILKYARTNF